MDLVLEARFRVQFGLVLRDVGKGAVDRRAARVGAQFEVAFQADAARRELACARDLRGIAAVLAAVRRAGLLRRGGRSRSKPRRPPAARQETRK